MIARRNLEIPVPAIAELCERYQVHELALFGSALRDDFDADSDIDMLVEFEPDATVSFFTLSRLERELANLFGRPVDLISKGGLNRIIQRSVLDSALVIYAR